jgi:energy-coupling factor transport system ATP-binding protein
MQPIIKTKDLWFSYDKANWILKGIDIEIYEGELISLIGPNGCGKTTLVKHFNGILKPSKGKVFVNNVDTTKTTAAELAKTVGYVFQNPNHQIFSNTVFEEVVFGPRNLGFKNLEEIASSSLATVGLKDKVKALPFSLSTGEKERLAIASLLSMQPKVLILDEPTTGQDYLTCEKIMEIANQLRKSGKTIIMITHDMEIVAEWSDRVFVMNDGKIVSQGKPKQIFSDFQFLERISLSPPQVLKIGRALGFKSVPLSIEELVEGMKKCDLLSM